MSTRDRTLVLCLGALICAGAASREPATAETVIEHNPFQRPPELQARASASEGPTLMAKGALELRGVLVAGSDSQANINGHIMKLGEEFDGYRLVSVSTDAAELRRGEEKIELRLQRGRDQ